MKLWPLARIVQRPHQGVVPADGLRVKSVHMLHTYNCKIYVYIHLQADTFAGLVARHRSQLTDQLDRALLLGQYVKDLREDQGSFAVCGASASWHQDPSDPYRAAAAPCRTR